MTRMTTLAYAWQRSRPWRLDALAGLLALLVGLYEMHGDLVVISGTGELLVVVGVAIAVGLSRLAPGAALGVAWCVGVVHVVTGTGPMVCEVLLAAVAFGCARWGSTLVLWLSAVSIPLGAAIAVVWLDPNVFYDSLRVAGVQGLARRAYDGTNGWRLPAALLGSALLMAPWLLGLALRFSERSEASRRSQVAAEAERDQAEEIARLREDQTRLARDVHDVVGHSLAVILAQAESAQYLDDADPAALKRTMTNIATSARTSLDDVRTVLASTQGAQAAPASQPDLESLLDGVRASGHVVESTVVGTPQPMPPDLEVVAFRVLQEMLTNAIKHGRRDRPVLVERHWDGELRVEVQNAVGPDQAGQPVHETQPIAGVPLPPTPDGGQGLDGMRRRLEGVGGRLDVRRRTDPPTFTATAWLPVRLLS
jgi:signal transduction histidine kinase